MMNTHISSDEDWSRVLSMLPADFEQSCIDKLAITRFRAIRSAGDLLRLCFAYSVCDLSLRQAAAWASTVGLAELSDVAVLKRVSAAGDWLGHLVMQWFQERGIAQNVPALTVRIVDGTVVSSPGRKAKDYRLHAAFDLQRRCLVDVELTDDRGGESLVRHTVCPEEVILADRGYGKRPQIAHVLAQGAHVVVRIHFLSMPLENEQGKPVDTLALLETLAGDEVGDWPVYMRCGEQRYPMRLVAVKKSREAAEKSIAQLKRSIQKHQRKHGDPRSIRAAWYTYMLTDLPRNKLSATEVLELYRMRWQVELAFKRIKSLLQLDLRARKPDLARSYIFANILASLMIEELSGNALSFFPWGFRLAIEAGQPLASL